MTKSTQELQGIADMVGAPEQPVANAGAARMFNFGGQADAFDQQTNNQDGADIEPLPIPVHNFAAKK